MIENLLENTFSTVFYGLIWYFAYIIFGFEVTVIAILLFILAELRG